MLKRCLWNWIAIPIGVSVLGFLPLIVVDIAALGLMRWFLSYSIFWLTISGLMVIIVLFF